MLNWIDKHVEDVFDRNILKRKHTKLIETVQKI